MKNYHCTLCNKSYFQSGDLIKHHKSVHEKTKSFVCHLCNKSLSRKTILESHMKKFHSNKDASKICQICNKKLVSDVGLKFHMTTVHSAKEKIQCDKCDKFMSNKSNLKRHVEINHEGFKGNHECKICLNTYYGPNKLMHHVNKTHKGLELKHYKCKLCDRSYAKVNDLKIHIELRHLQKRDFKCESPDMAFTNIQWERHHWQKNHSDEAVNKCDLCEKTFEDKCKLHGKHFEFQCGICNKGFETGAELTLHSELGLCQSQAPNEILKCDSCEISFANGGDFLQHEDQIHQRAEKYKCNHCSKFFPQKDMMKKHLRTIDLYDKQNMIQNTF